MDHHRRRPLDAPRRQLNHSTELNQAETDPVVADSDSAHTKVDKTDNNVTDGNKDFDANQLGTAYEYGTDPLMPDVPPKVSKVVSLVLALSISESKLSVWVT